MASSVVYLQIIFDLPFIRFALRPCSLCSFMFYHFCYVSIPFQYVCLYGVNGGVKSICVFIFPHFVCVGSEAFCYPSQKFISTAFFKFIFTRSLSTFRPVRLSVPQLLCRFWFYINFSLFRQK